MIVDVYDKRLSVKSFYLQEFSPNIYIYIHFPFSVVCPYDLNSMIEKTNRTCTRIINRDDGSDGIVLHRLGRSPK